MEKVLGLTEMLVGAVVEAGKSETRGRQEGRGRHP